MSVQFMGQVVGDSQTEVIRERYTVVLTFRCDDVAPLVGAIDAGSAIRICGLVSGKLNCVRVQPSEATIHEKALTRFRHKGDIFDCGFFLLSEITIIELKSPPAAP